MELSQPLLQLLTSIGVGPVWLIPITLIVTLVLQKYFPGILNKPNPVVPNPTPVDPNSVKNPTVPVNPALNDRPILSLLLQILSIKALGGVKVEENQLIDAVLKEVVGLKKLEIKE